MSLFMGIAYGDEFVLASSDSMVAYVGPDDDGNIDQSLVIEADFRSEKVFPISDKVFLCTTGDHFALEYFQKLLKKRINPEDDLEICVKKTKQLIADIKHDIEKETPEKIEKISPFQWYFLPNIPTLKCQINLFGFSDDGKAGAAYYNPESDEMEISKGLSRKGGFIAKIAGPHSECKDYLELLNLPKESRILENFINQFLIIHSIISSKYKNVSSDCNLHALYKVGDKIEYEKVTIDTAGLYERILLQEEIMAALKNQEAPNSK